jgi:hypothetical protein
MTQTAAQCLNKFAVTAAPFTDIHRSKMNGVKMAYQERLAAPMGILHGMAAPAADTSTWTPGIKRNTDQNKLRPRNGRRVKRQSAG